MNHIETINYLIEKYNYKSYLEIGYDRGDCYNKINIEHKECCDISNIKNAYPETEITYLMTSDELFERMPIDKKYDIVFIDGMHNQYYLDRDIINSLKHLNPGGIILCHDVLPVNYMYTSEYQIGGMWHGDCWKSVPKLQDLNVEYYTYDNNDCGLLMIKYKDNPYQLQNIRRETSVQFDTVFTCLDTTCDEHLRPVPVDVYEYAYTKQGYYIMHIIHDKEFFEIFG